MSISSASELESPVSLARKIEGERIDYSREVTGMGGRLFEGWLSFEEIRFMENGRGVR